MEFATEATQLAKCTAKKSLMLHVCMWALVYYAVLLHENQVHLPPAGKQKQGLVACTCHQQYYDARHRGYNKMQTCKFIGCL